MQLIESKHSMIVQVGDDLQELKLDDLSKLRFFGCNEFNFVQIGTFLYDNENKLMLTKQLHGTIIKIYNDEED